jgi:hypothetical protein
MEWSEVKSRQLKCMAAGIGAIGAITMGVMGVAFSEAPAGTGPVTVGVGEMTLGETVTTTTGATELGTTFVTPPVTAEPPDGFGP